MELTVPTAPKITLWHNPKCSKSRRALELLEMTDCEVEIYDYQADPPSPEKLRELLGWLGVGTAPMAAKQLARKKEAAWTEQGLEHLDDDALVAALCQNPALIERPIAVAAENAEAIVGRPPELVLKLLIPKLPEGTQKLTGSEEPNFRLA